MVMARGGGGYTSQLGRDELRCSVTVRWGRVWVMMSHMVPDLDLVSVQPGPMGLDKVQVSVGLYDA